MVIKGLDIFYGQFLTIKTWNGRILNNGNDHQILEKGWYISLILFSWFFSVIIFCYCFYHSIYIAIHVDWSITWKVFISCQRTLFVFLEVISNHLSCIYLIFFIQKIYWFPTIRSACWTIYSLGNATNEKR